MTPPESPIWDFLDLLGLPFRETAGDLVARFGTRSCPWADTFRECDLPVTPLLLGLSAFSFQVLPGDDMSMPPNYLTASYRGAGFRLTDVLRDSRAVRNFDQITGAVTRLLGPGCDVSSSNNLSRRWQTGIASVEVSCFPPHLNRCFGPNARDRLDPGSKHEAVIALTPFYKPPLSDEALGWLAAFKESGKPAPVPRPREVAPPRWHRWPVELGPEPPAGYGLSPDGAGFVVVSNDFAIALPRASLICLRRVVMFPAKGAGWASLELGFTPAKGVRLHFETLLTAPPTADALRAEADELVSLLNLPLHHVEDMDC